MDVDVIPDAATRYTRMRALAFGVLLVIAGCSGPTAAAPPPRTPTPSSSTSSSPSPSPSPWPSPVVTPLPRPVAGGVLEYSIAAPGASPSAMTAAPDGNLWFVDVGDPNRISRVTTSGVITGFAVPGAVGGPETMTVGPDGNIWMVANGGGTGAESWILRVSPEGVVTKFPVPGAGPDGITTGPDGNLWFTEFFRNMIGRMSPAGVLLNEFPIPIGSARGIVTGPDGNLWFTEAGTGSSAIARMSRFGEVSEFSLVGNSDESGFNPIAIVAGPDGNLWFTEAGKIGRITIAGAITEFRLPGTRNPQGLTVGPDGNIWFTVSEGAVGRITPSGTIRLFPLPGRNAQPIGIAAGSDGRIWFTEAGVNRIGSIGETVPEVGLASHLVTFGTGALASTRTVTITNSGDAALSISAVKIAGDATAAFRIVRNTCRGRTVGVGAACQVEVALTPRAGGGVLAGLLQLTDNATASPQSVSLVAQLPACRLPVFTRSESPASVQGGFLDLRTGVFAPDSRATFEFNSKTGQYQSKTSPTLIGLLPASYDPVTGRWLPTGSASTSPDHSRYAYSGFSPTNIDRLVHVVDVATGRDRVITLPRGPWNVVGYGSDGIYLNQSYEGTAPGLTLVNPDTGIVRSVFPDGVVFAVGAGFAWTGAFNPRDAVPPPPSMGGTNNEVARRDLATGQKTPWLYVSGANLYVSAVSQTTVLVTGYFRHGSGTWIVSGANQAQRLTIPGTAEDFTFNGGLVSDAAGVWLAGPSGIYLWRPGTGLSLVSEVGATPAGGCI